MKIYNTLTRKKEELKPLKDHQLGMYVCGPTVYDYDHLGHARVGIFYDTLRRYLIEQGFSVKYVQNITDVGHLTEETGEDKIEKKAKEEETDPKKIAKKFTKAHFEDMASLSVQKPDYSPRASEYISQIIDFIKVLIKKGYAYEAKGNVYFEIEKFKDYGKLSGRDFRLQGVSRVEPGAGKKKPADFALWIAAPPEHILKYDSPWGKGYPGWHIECSVMNHEFFGAVTDIHGGANELIFPHHENEIAQSQAYSGKKPVRYFVHIGMVTIDGEKMSKSKGNFIRIRDLLKKYDSDTIRIFILKSPYRSPIDYSNQNLIEARKIKKKLLRARQKAKSGKAKLKEEINQILDDDFNTAKALNFFLDNLPRATSEDFEYLKEIFGFCLKSKKIKLTEGQQKLIEDREEARKKEDWRRADELRKTLEKQGIEIEDTRKGPKVKYE